jgi:predicted kinase
MIDPDAGGTDRELVIPDPSLVVLMGPAGAGKSTFAQRWFRPDEVLSSDALRAAVSGDPANQASSSAAFAILHRQLARRLAAGRLTVVDATNVQRAARRNLLLLAQRTGWPAIEIVLDLPGPMVHARNAARTERVVEASVVDDQLLALRVTLAPGRLFVEGFQTVHRLSSAKEVDSVRVVRVGHARRG